jgi:hypothetical protein
LETILFQRAVKNSRVMDFAVPGKEIVALFIPYKITNLPFGLLRLGIEEMYIANVPTH